MTAIFRKPPYAEYLHMSSSDKYANMPFFHHTGSHVKMINLAFLKMLGSPYVVTMAFLSPVLRLKACRCHGCRCWGAGTCSNEATAGAAAIPKKGCLVSSNPPGKKKQNSSKRASLCSHTQRLIARAIRILHMNMGSYLGK